VHLGEREVSVGEAQPPAETPLHFLDDRERPSEERALVVPVLDERDRRIGWSLDLVATADRQDEAYDGGLTDVLTDGHGASFGVTRFGRSVTSPAASPARPGSNASNASLLPSYRQERRQAAHAAIRVIECPMPERLPASGGGRG
jgi:hypothetical protein